MIKNRLCGILRLFHIMTHSICLIIQSRVENYFFSGSLAVSLPDAGFFSEIHIVRTKVDIFDYITSLKNVKKLKKVFYYLIHLLCYIVWLNIYLIRYFSDNVVVRFILSLLEYDYSQ